MKILKGLAMATVAVGLLFSAGSLQAQDPGDGPQCWALSPPKAHQCYGAVLLAQEQRLKRASDHVVDQIAGDIPAINAFTQTQAAWEQFRDKECAWRQTIADVGQYGAIFRLRCLGERTSERADTVESYQFGTW